jgi:DNA (cytosine-5)-methyltransferase 1
MALTAIELCAGGGGQAVGLEAAGFEHAALVEYEPGFCATLRLNRPTWNTVQEDVRNFQAIRYAGVDLLAAGVPCPPFSVAGRQLGADDERDMFPAALNAIGESRPKAVLIENVPGLAQARFKDYRSDLAAKLKKMGYASDWRVLQAADYGVPQLRPRFVMVAFLRGALDSFRWPDPVERGCTVGSALEAQMGSCGWPGATTWSKRAAAIAPTVVGGSKKHGGPDLGPTRAKEAWRQLGVDPMGIADVPPSAVFPAGSAPRLTVNMVATLQGFPAGWRFWGGKTVAYRQVGNAFPAPVARAVGQSISAAIRRSTRAVPLLSRPKLAASN